MATDARERVGVAHAFGRRYLRRLVLGLVLAQRGDVEAAEPAIEEGTEVLTFEDPERKSAFAEAFGFEVRAAAQLDHPCVTTVYDHGFVAESESTGAEFPAGAPWLAMELVDGGTLADERSPKTWSTLKRITLDVLDGLAHAHARGLIHRDIKPGNVLMDREGRLVISDFGLAIMVDRSIMRSAPSPIRHG